MREQSSEMAPVVPLPITVVDGEVLVKEYEMIFGETEFARKMPILVPVFTDPLHNNAVLALDAIFRSVQILSDKISLGEWSIWSIGDEKLVPMESLSQSWGGAMIVPL